ncbi:sigma-70 family RNA polymerase sigma factor [Chitinophaga horti]|uniref:Sigma-70 family RNA polymerase sigma factor n=1 Tax=Chitinophaga horti TaxID=2920382 RepID=A0ABY6J2U3_9BACT|nr:sigma-70 family RNA polymerase sigma factor [Chitinophaga horti]UYQ92514.1 sigma-70 family RNA polymerase sigma factor [Chitinophaga horti]
MRLLGDSDLLGLVREDDGRAFTEIYERYWDRLYATAWHHLKDATAAEEVVQDVFVTIWQKRHTLIIEELSKYLAAMVRYGVYRYLAREQQRRTLHDNAAIKPGVDAYELEHKLLLEMVNKLSGELPEKCRIVFRATKLHDQSLGDVARQLNISPKTAEAHLTKALRLIRMNLGKAFHFFF